MTIDVLASVVAIDGRIYAPPDARRLADALRDAANRADDCARARDLAGHPPLTLRAVVEGLAALQRDVLR